MVQNIWDMKLVKVREAANLVEIEFPDCCLSCGEYDGTPDTEYCRKLQIPIDNPFSICNHHSE